MTGPWCLRQHAISSVVRRPTTSKGTLFFHPWSLLKLQGRKRNIAILLGGVLVWCIWLVLQGEPTPILSRTPLVVENIQPNAKNKNDTSTVTQGMHEPKQPAIPASELPDASDWVKTDETPHEVCFVTSVYGPSEDSCDKPPSVQEIRDHNPTFQFLAFTNLQGLDAPGWTKIVHDLSQYKRYITQSRWAKFVGWKHPSVRGCQAVFYMDGFCSPKAKHSDRYKRLAKAIHQSEFGLFQNEHDLAVGPLVELDRIVTRNKDIPKNVEASRKWLLAQPDFNPDATLYANHYIGYDPMNRKFQEAASFFWSHYELEEDSWRDQPLWSYVLDRFHITPTRLGTFEALFKEHYKRMGHGGHRYDDTADNNAA